MFIVSQDNKTIVNLDNVISIYIEDEYEGGVCDINTTTSTDNWIFRLGQYSTPERAKEVLNEILDYRSAMFALRREHLSNTVLIKTIQDRFPDEHLDCYTMPADNKEESDAC